MKRPRPTGSTRYIRTTTITAGSSANVHRTAFIATDKGTAMHIIMCADVFIRSFSWLFTHISARLSRGVGLLPSDTDRTNTIGSRLWFTVNRSRLSNSNRQLVWQSIARDYGGRFTDRSQPESAFEQNLGLYRSHSTSS